MVIERRLKLLTPLLAMKREPNTNPPKRVFVNVDVPGVEGTHIKTQLPRWNWSFLEARDALELDDVAVATIIPFHYYTVKRTSTYNRNFSRVGKRVREQFESLPSGQAFDMKFTLSKHLPPDCDGGGRFTRPPDEEEFDAMLAHIGEHLGMSEWGHAYLYGRFKIVKKKENGGGGETA
jgi:hypothetical protein